MGVKDFKAVHTGQAKLISKTVKKNVEMKSSIGRRIIMRKTRCTNLHNGCQSVVQIVKGVMISSRGDGGWDDMPTLHWY